MPDRSLQGRFERYRYFGEDAVRAEFVGRVAVDDLGKAAAAEDRATALAIGRLALRPTAFAPGQHQAARAFRAFRPPVEIDFSRRHGERAVFQRVAGEVMD